MHLRFASPPFRRWLAAAFLASLVGVARVCAAQAGAPVVALGAEDDAGPWSYADGTGFVDDVVRSAFNVVGWQVQLEPMPYARCKRLAIGGSLAGCFSASRKPDLEEELIYSRQPVIEPEHLMLARSDSALNGCGTLGLPSAPLRLGLVRGYEYSPGVDRLVSQGHAVADVTDSEVSNLRKLAIGRIDAAVVTVDEVKKLQSLLAASGVSLRFKVVCNFGPLPAFVVFSRSHPQGAAAAAAFDEGYARLVRSGEIARLKAAWRQKAFDPGAVKPH